MLRKKISIATSGNNAPRKGVGRKGNIKDGVEGRGNTKYRGNVKEEGVTSGGSNYERLGE